MQQVTVGEAKLNLVDLIDAAVSGEEVIITREGGLSVQLVPRVAKTRKRQFGSATGLIFMSADFDAPLDDLKEYMEKITLAKIVVGMVSLSVAKSSLSVTYRY